MPDDKLDSTCQVDKRPASCSAGPLDRRFQDASFEVPVPPAGPARLPLAWLGWTVLGGVLFSIAGYHGHLPSTLVGALAAFCVYRALRSDGARSP